MVSEGSVPCFGCGGLFPDITGPSHRYMEGSPGCWAVFGEILAREYSEFHNPECHRLTADTYPVQHPGKPSAQSIQSVGGHLAALHLSLERGYDAKKTMRVLRRIVERSAQLVWLTPPTSPGWLTVLDVRGARDLAEHSQR